MSTTLRTVLCWFTAAAAIAAVWWFTATDDLPFGLWRTYSPSVAMANVAASGVVAAAAFILSGGAAWRRRVAQTALLGGAVGLTLALLELPAAAFGYDYGLALGTRPAGPWIQWYTGVNRRDDELIHLHKPHSTFVGSLRGNRTFYGMPDRPPYRVDVAYDQHGFRNSQDFTSADVVAIGDSFVEGAEVSKDEVITAQLTRRLGIPVVNLGQSDYSPEQELVVLRRYGLPLSPKLVVWFFFGGNDLADVDTYRWRRSHLDTFLAPPDLSARTFTRNALVALAAFTTPVRRTETEMASKHAFNVKLADGRIERQYVDGVEGPWEPGQWQTASAALAAAHDLAERAGSKMLVVYIPRKLRVYAGYLDAPPDAFARQWTSNSLPDVVAAWCRERGLPFLDATVALRAAVAAGRSVYLTDDVHWNADGHAVTAEAVALRIGELGMLPAGGERTGG